MAVNTPNPGTFGGTISQVVVNLRNDFQSIVNLNNYVTAMGGVTFLQNSEGMSVNDAAMVVAVLGNLATLATVYHGATPGATFDYSTNSQQLWGGM